MWGTGHTLLKVYCCVELETTSWTDSRCEVRLRPAGFEDSSERRQAVRPNEESLDAKPPRLHVSDDISASDRESCSVDHAQEPDLERQTLSQ